MQWPRQQIVRKSFAYLLLAGTLLGVPMPAKAADVGLFYNVPTSAIASPVNDKTYLLQNSVLYVYHASSWVSLMPALPNLTAVVPPTITDDSGSGYGIGSQWVDTVGHQIYLCEDATVGAAVWVQISDPLHFADVLNKLTTADAFSDWLVSGLLGTVPSSSLSMTTPSGVAIVTGLRIVKGSYSFTYSASKDTYEYLQNDASILRVVLANGASAPTGQPGLPLQKVVTGSSAITAVTQLAPLAPSFASGASFQQAQIVTTAAHALLPNARVLTDGAGIHVDNSNPGQSIIGLTGSVPSTSTGNIWGPSEQEFQAAPKIDANAFKTAAGQNLAIPETTDTLVGRATTDTLTNKTATSLQLGDNTLKTALGASLLIPEAADTLVGKATVDSLTNKTLTSPKLSDNTIKTSAGHFLTAPEATDTLVGQATTDSLTNKTIVSPTITGTIVGTPTWGTPIASTNLTHGATRQVENWAPGGDLALGPSSTIYHNILFLRSGKITGISIAASIVPIDTGTCLITLKQGSPSGPTIMSVSQYDMIGMTSSGTQYSIPLTSTSADLTLSATQPIFCEIDITTPGTMPAGVTVGIEFQPDDF